MKEYDAYFDVAVKMRVRLRVSGQEAGSLEEATAIALAMPAQKVLDGLDMFTPVNPEGTVRLARVEAVETVVVGLASAGHVHDAGGHQ